MKYLTALLSVLFLVGITGSVLSQGKKLSNGPPGWNGKKQVWCTLQQKELYNMLETNYNEEFKVILGVINHEIGGEITVVLYDGATSFTVVERFSNGTVCVISSGYKKGRAA